MFSFSWNWNTCMCEHCELLHVCGVNTLCNFKWRAISTHTGLLRLDRLVVKFCPLRTAFSDAALLWYAMLKLNREQSSKKEWLNWFKAWGDKALQTSFVRILELLGNFPTVTADSQIGDEPMTELQTKQSKTQGFSLPKLSNIAVPVSLFVFAFSVILTLTTSVEFRISDWCVDRLLSSSMLKHNHSANPSRTSRTLDLLLLFALGPKL